MKTPKEIYLLQKGSQLLGTWSGTPQIENSGEWYSAEYKYIRADLVEQKLTEWSEDEKIRKTLLRCCDDWEKGQFGCMAKENVTAIRAYLEKQKEQKTAEWSEEDEEMIARICANLEYLIKEAGCDSKLKEKLEERIKWMKRLKSLRPQPHQTVEDKSISEEILKYFNEKKDYRSRWYVWVKYASRNPRWKPSEEQMDRLFSIVVALRKDYCDDMADFLASLYKQLEKL